VPRVARVATLWRGDPGAATAATRNHARLRPILAAMTKIGLTVEPVLYDETVADGLVDRLRGFDAVLVWVDPISGERDREALDALLRDVAGGPWVSAHPDTILKMGTKEVLYRTRDLGWGADTRLYASLDAFRPGISDSLAAGSPRVLKQNRGNGGIGVWKVTPLDLVVGSVRVQHAAPRDDATEDMTLDDFLNRCAPYFAGDGRVIDQPFAARLAEGMIRAYLVEREVVGFARQLPASRAVDPAAPEPDRVLGMPSAKTMYPAHETEFRRLRERLEQEWVPQLCEVLDIDDAALPVLWDADFFYGARDDDGADSYMLCEINVSSVIPYPDAAAVKVAHAVQRRCEAIASR
jgi:Domain of unknown function (DUF6815)